MSDLIELESVLLFDQETYILSRNELEKVREKRKNCEEMMEGNKA